MTGVPGLDGPIGVVIVTYESAGVIGECLDSILRAAPRRGVEVRVVDNASRDASVEIATARLGPGRVIRQEENRGFAAGVNRGMDSLATPWIAVVNPDTRVPEGALDRLADELARDAGAGLIAPYVVDGEHHPEQTVGRFPTWKRERAHTWFLDRLWGAEGRKGVFPETSGPVDWVSGCFWLLRSAAHDAIGPLDDGFFMYYEDVDYCRRLHDAGWRVIATRSVEVQHAIGRGSSATARIPADGGSAVLHYFRKHLPGIPEARVAALLQTGWRLRLMWRNLRAALGHRPSAAIAARYRLAIDQLRNRRS